MSGFLGGLEEIYTGGMDEVQGGCDGLEKMVKENPMTWGVLGVVGIVFLVLIAIALIMNFMDMLTYEYITLADGTVNRVWTIVTNVPKTAPPPPTDPKATVTERMRRRRF